MPRNQLNVVEKIEKVLLSSGRAMSLHKLSKRTGLHYTTVKRYVKLIEAVKEMPDIDVIRGDRTTLVRIGSLSELPEEEQIRIIKMHFPRLDEEGKFLIELMEKNATSKEKAIKVKENKIIRKLLKQEQLRKTKDGKIYLTELGYRIAYGAKKIYKK